MKQDTLPGVPRARVPIREDAVAGATQGELALRADRDFGNPHKGHMEVDAEGFVGYTPWRSPEAPPCTGLWEVTDHETGTQRARWWYDADRRAWSSSPGAQNAASIGPAAFATLYAWRGLAQRPLTDYECPPYDLRTAPPGCQLDVRVPFAPRRERTA